MRVGKNTSRSRAVPGFGDLTGRGLGAWPATGWPHATEGGKLILKQAMAGVAGVLPTGRGA